VFQTALILDPITYLYNQNLPPRGLLAIGMPGCVVAGTKIKVKKISKEGNVKIYEK